MAWPTRLPTAGAVNVNGGVLNMLTFSGSTGAVTLTSGTISGSGVLTGTSYNVQSGEIDATLGGSTAVLTKNTAGLVTLGGANTYGGGTTISSGTLLLASGGSIGAGSISITPSAVFDTSALPVPAASR